MRPPLPPFTEESAMEKVRLSHWPVRRRPDDPPDLAELGL